MSRPVFYAFLGKTLTVHGWAREVGIGYMTIKERLKAGWLVEDAIFKPVGECPERKIVRRGNDAWHALSDEPRGMSDYRRSV